MTIRLLKLCSALDFSGAPFAPAAPLPPIPTSTGIVEPLWPAGKMPGHGAAQPETRDPAGVADENVEQFTNVSDPMITVYKAPDAKGPVPAMIICPGGGYGILAYWKEGVEIAAWLNSLGITGIVLKYRVPGDRDGAFQDVQRAMCLARKHATEWGIQADKLGVMGFSAGGHLSARLSTNFSTPAYPARDAADALSCRPDFVILVYPAYLEVNGKLPPELPVSAQTPPTLIVHNADDHPYLPSSEIYDAALTAAAVPHQFLFYPTGGHGYGMRSDKAVKVWPAQSAEWLHKIGVI
jgi:acetyl esterase/lipase